MTLSGRPLLDNRVDWPLFAGRQPELTRLNAALDRGLNVLITGDAGIGKTSLLHAYRYRSRTVQPAEAADADADAAITYVRAEGILDGAELLERITAAVLGVRAGGPRSGAADPAGFGLVDRLGTAAESAAVSADGMPAESADGVRGGPNGMPGRPGSRVIVVDDVTATAGHALFGRLRDELWSLELRWVVAARTGDRGGLTLPPADAFFEEQLILAPLDAEAAAELLRRRLPRWPPATISRVVDAIGGNPRALLNAVRTIGDIDANPGAASGLDADGSGSGWEADGSASGGVESVLAAIGRRDAAIVRSGRPEAMLAAELDAIGAASASDTELLDRLGWTRARAVQVLTRMEGLGLVRSDDVKLGRGRPRKVYRLVTPTEYELSVGQARISP